MIEIKRMAAQGDMLIRKVKAIPKGFTEKKHDGRIVLAHSETQHNHVTDVAPDFMKVLENPADPLVCYLQMGDICSFDIEHLRSYDTHETLRVVGSPGDIWEVRRQREHTPEGWRRAQD